MTLHFLSTFLPTRGRGGDVDADRAWRIEWSPMFFQMCQATGGTLLFDLDLYRDLSPGARRLFLKLKDRFWRSKRVFMNVDDLTINGLGFSADRPLKKRKFDLTDCIRELLDHHVIELGRGHSDPKDLFLKRGKGMYVVQFFEGPYFRQPATERTLSQKQAIADDPLYQPLRAIGVDEAGTQPGKSLDLRQVMDDGKVLIVNLSKGRVGEDNSTLLGAFLVTSIQQAAMTRADVPEISRRDFYLYVDEFQNFTTDSFASVLSEARKFRLSLIVAHQYLSQLNEQTAGAVWGNVGSIVAFQVGSDDAEALSQQLSKFPGQVAQEHLTGLPKYTAYTRLLIDGLPSNPFSMQTLPPPVHDFDPDRAEIIRRVSRRRFALDANTAPTSKTESQSASNT